MEQLRLAGHYTVSDEYDDLSQVVIINTCGFINDAKEESIDTILKYAGARKRGKIEKLIITGCLAERYHDDLKKEIPEADGIYGVNHAREITGALSAEFISDYADRRVLTGPGHYAYLKISEGCSRSCSFCAIPMIRGRYISRPEEEILTEARYLASLGVRELILVAQDLTYYGMDLYGEQRLAALVQRLSDMALFRWIRLHYLYPAGFPEGLISVFRDRPDVCRYVDIPIQHISGKVLKMMNREHTAAGTVRLLEKIRKELPGAAIRTTLIVGHPGEGEKEFKQLYDFVCDFRFDRLGVFAYSHEDKTPADRKYSDNIPAAVKNDRLSAIMELQQDISSGLNEGMKGRTLDVVLDRREGEWMTGRTEYDSPEIDQEVLIKYDSTLGAGDFRQVLITGTGVFDLTGDIVAG